MPLILQMKFIHSEATSSADSRSHWKDHWSSLLEVYKTEKSVIANPELFNDDLFKSEWFKKTLIKKAENAQWKIKARKRKRDPQNSSQLIPSPSSTPDSLLYARRYKLRDVFLDPLHGSARFEVFTDILRRKNMGTFDVLLLAETTRLEPDDQEVSSYANIQAVFRALRQMAINVENINVENRSVMERSRSAFADPALLPCSIDAAETSGLIFFWLPPQDAVEIAFVCTSLARALAIGCDYWAAGMCVLQVAETLLGLFADRSHISTRIVQLLITTAQSYILQRWYNGCRGNFIAPEAQQRLVRAWTKVDAAIAQHCELKQNLWVEPYTTGLLMYGLVTLREIPVPALLSNCASEQARAELTAEFAFSPWTNSHALLHEVLASYQNQNVEEALSYSPLYRICRNFRMQNKYQACVRYFDMLRDEQPDWRKVPTVMRVSLHTEMRLFVQNFSSPDNAKLIEWMRKAVLAIQALLPTNFTEGSSVKITSSVTQSFQRMTLHDTPTVDIHSPQGVLKAREDSTHMISSSIPSPPLLPSATVPPGPVSSHYAPSRPLTLQPEASSSVFLSRANYSDPWNLSVQDAAAAATGDVSNMSATSSRAASPTAIFRTPIPPSARLSSFFTSPALLTAPSCYDPSDSFLSPLPVSSNKISLPSGSPQRRNGHVLNR
jgi:hypothetical protein